MRSVPILLATAALAVPAAARAQLPRAPVLPADLRAVRVETQAPARPHAPRPSPLSRGFLLFGTGAFGAACDGFALPCAPPAPAAAIAPHRVPRTRVIEVGASTPVDSACGWATHARALTDCLGAAVREEDGHLSAATVRAREPLLRTRPAAAVAAFDSAAAAWSRYRDRECRAQSLALGGAASSYQALACQLRLARERRALLDGAPVAVSGAAPAPAR